MVEDDQNLGQLLKDFLDIKGYSTTLSRDGEEGLEAYRNNVYDLAILDIMMPKKDGFALGAEIREMDDNLPIIYLTARSRQEDKINGFRIGADDYLTKPFAFSELLARVQALIRRASGASEPTRLSCGDLTIDMLTREVRRAGIKIELQPLEYSLLEYLMRNAERVVSKTMIMEHVWDYHFDPQTNVVEARICRLRDKVDKGFDEKLIHTVRGVGYALRRND